MNIPNTHKKIQYAVQFYRSDFKRIDFKTVSAISMNEAVKQVLNKAEKDNVKITKIAVSVQDKKQPSFFIERQTPQQLYCHDCNINPASWGVHDKWYCSSCIHNENND